MINFMKSEIYRSLHNKYIRYTTIVYAVLLVLVDVVLAQYVHDPTFEYSTTAFALSNIYYQMQMFLLFTVVLAMGYFGSEDKDHTLKHTISFGFDRKTVYFGKFIIQSIICIGIYIVLCTGFTALSFLLLNHSNLGELGLLVRFSASSLTCLLWAIALTQLFMLYFNSSNVAVTVTVVVTLILPVILNDLGKKIEFIYAINNWIPYNLVAFDGPIAKGGTEIWKAVFAGLAWLIVTLLIGYKLFDKKEIK